MRGKSDGGSRGRGKQEQDEEEYSEEEEETSSTSVANSGDEEEEDEDSDEDDENEEEEEEKITASRKSGRMSGGNTHSDPQAKGRLTRQKAREEMPAKRLLRSRQKPPAAGGGSRVPQVFKCANCKKEFNNKVSLGRHGGWCKQKSTKNASPRKKKEDGIKKTVQSEVTVSSVREVNIDRGEVNLPSSSRGRGRPKKNPIPSEISFNESSSLQHFHENNHEQLMLQQRYQEQEILSHGHVVQHRSSVEQDFMQQRSPQSSPGMMDTSSEEDYEQKEFAANAHQLISHRSNSNVSIDVVNTEISSEHSEGPVTCPQCKMTYRTLQGFQNHFPSCSGFSSEEENDEGDLDEDVPRHQSHSGPNWGRTETMPETVIGPPNLHINTNMDYSPAIMPGHDAEPETSLEEEPYASHEPVPEQPPRTYQEISILSGKSPIKIILPPDNTPQVINAAGLTLERLEASPVPKSGFSHSQLGSPARKAVTPSIDFVQNTPVMSSPIQRISSNHLSIQNHNIHPQLTNVAPTSSFPPSAHCHIHSGASLSSHLTPASATTTIMSTSITGSTAPAPIIPHPGNPPTYTQAQLMPGTVLHNSIMQVPQQMGTSMGDLHRHHIHQPQTLSTPGIPQLAGGHFPSYTQAPSLPPQPQPLYRVQNGITSVSHGLPQTHTGLFPGTSSIDPSSQQVPGLPPIQNNPRLPAPASHPMSHLYPQMATAAVGPSQATGQLPQGQMLPIGQQQQSLVYANGQYGLVPNQSMPPHPVGIPQGQQFPQSMHATMSMPFQQLNGSQLQFQNQQNGLPLQQPAPIPQQPISTTSLPGGIPNANDQLSQQFQTGQAVYPPYFQNQVAGFTRLPGDPSAQQHLQTVMQQQAMLQNAQNSPMQSMGGLPFQMQQMLQSHPHTAMQFSSSHQIPQPNLSQATFAQGNQPHIPSQLPASQSIQPVSNPLPPSLLNTPPVAAPPIQPGTTPLVAPGQATVQQSLPNGVELNVQQQAQLQQQQQQFLALQQQQQQLQIQQASSDAKPTVMPPQNLQAVMINNTIQWIRTPQPAQHQLQSSTPAPLPQQQPANSEISNSASVPQAPQQQQVSTAPTVPVSQALQPPNPQVIQQLAQVTDSAGNTYLIMLPTQPQQQNANQSTSQTGNATVNESNVAQILNLVSGLPGLASQTQTLNQRANVTPTKCIAVPGHSPGSSSHNGSFHSMGKSSPCPCAACKEKTGTANVMEKFKKVLPHPSPNDSPQPHFKPIVPNIAPKPAIAARPAMSKPLAPKVVRVQAATTRPAIQLAFAHPAQLQNPSAPPQTHPASQLKLMPIQPQSQMVGVPGAVGNANVPISSPNIAVVRPMENPLQKLSDQISQIESTFMAPSVSSSSLAPQQLQHPNHINTTTAIVDQTSPPPGHHFTLVSTSPPPPTSTTITFQIPGASTSPAQLISTHVITLDPPLADEDPIGHSSVIADPQVPVELIPEPRLGLVDHGTCATAVSNTVPESPQISSPGSSIQSISNPNTPVRNGSSVPAAASGVKRKILQVSPSASGGSGPAAKSIRLTLHKMGDGDSYSIKKIERGSTKANGSYKSLKIKGRILSSRLTNGPQEGTATNVVIVPCIRIVPNPDPDTNDGNVTIAEDDNSNVENIDTSSQRGGDNNNNSSGNGRSNLRLTHRAVIVYEGRMESNNKVLFQSSDVLDVWDRVFQIVQGTRLNHNLPPISYPATNIALPQNEVEAQAVFNKLGLTHRALNFLLQKLPGLEALSKAQNQPERKVTSQLPSASSTLDTNSESIPTPIRCPTPVEYPQAIKSEDEDDNEDIIEYNESGCARLEKFRGRKAFDMFGWLTSKHRNQVIESNRSTIAVRQQEKSNQCLKFLSAPLGMRYRKMKEIWREYLVTKKSDIQGIGLFTMRDIEKGEMVIEYAGEVIRPLVCDIREKYYESKAIGCYMFRINDHVIDATIKGNAARFINHSCEPNCEARTVKISGKDHIIIFSLQRIPRGKELTYDYKFEKEEEKIPCLCKSKHCRKYLN